MRTIHLFYTKEESEVQVLLLNRSCWTRFYCNSIKKIAKKSFSRMKLIMHYIDKIRNVYGNREWSKIYYTEQLFTLNQRENDFFFVNSINKFILWFWADIQLSILCTSIIKQRKNYEVPPRFELGSLDSKSRVLTITPWDHMIIFLSLFAWISPLKTFFLCVVFTRHLSYTQST